MSESKGKGRKEGRAPVSQAQLTEFCSVCESRRIKISSYTLQEMIREYEEDLPSQLIVPLELRVLHEFPGKGKEREKERAKVSFRSSFLPFLFSSLPLPKFTL